MAHFAELDDDDSVLRVIVVDNREMIGEDALESEAKGIAFCRMLFGQETRWKQASYNGKKRFNFPGPGFVYDRARDAFIPPRPGKDWALDEETCQWVNPDPEPEAALAAFLGKRK